MRKRIPRPTSVPMLVARGIHNTDVEIKERMCVTAFECGWATPDHFDYLRDMHDAMAMAAIGKHDQPAVAICEAARYALEGIRVRFQQTNSLKATPQEIATLRSFVGAYRDFWMRQPEGYYQAALDALDQARGVGARAVEVRT